MPRKREESVEGEAKPLSAFAANLRRLIDGEGEPGSGSVNAWAKDHNLPQPTVRRLVIGDQSATMDMIERIAKAVGMQPWQMLVPGVDLKNPPVINAPLEQVLYQRLRATQEAIAGVLQVEGNTMPGDLEEHPSQPVHGSPPVAAKTPFAYEKANTTARARHVKRKKEVK